MRKIAILTASVATCGGLAWTATRDDGRAMLETIAVRAGLRAPAAVARCSAGCPWWSMCSILAAIDQSCSASTPSLTELSSGSLLSTNPSF